MGKDCRFCRFTESGIVPGGQIIHRSGDWVLGRIPDREVPGWLVLWLARHGVGLSSLTAGEAAALGGVLRRVCAALEEVTGAERVYLASFSEHDTHLHGILVARTARVPMELRGPRLLCEYETLCDAGEAVRVGTEVARVLG
jgi:diadenosine tetraphosphate (Ap4A) HIT family hydrolase